MESNSSKLGFFFVIFQSQLNGYIKCWMDGKESWDYYSVDEIFDLLEKLDDSYKIKLSLAEAFSQTSFFLWDVDANKVTRLQANQMQETENSIVAAIADLKNRSGVNQDPMNAKKASILSIFKNTHKLGSIQNIDDQNVIIEVKK